MALTAYHAAKPKPEPNRPARRRGHERPHRRPESAPRRENALSGPVSAVMKSDRHDRRPRPPKKKMQQRPETPGIHLTGGEPSGIRAKRTPPMNKLRVIPLGGLGEIGKNMTAFEYGNDIIVVDCGGMFPPEELLGIDLVIPDVSYLVENRHKIRAIIFTHGHEDHISGTGYIWPRLNVPMYGLPLTAGLIEAKLAEFDLQRAKVNVIKTRQTLKFGVFTVETFALTHSIPDTIGLAIGTPEGIVAYTTDWKFDHTPIWGEPTDFQKLIELSQRGVLLHMSDSTNAERPGYTISERVVGETIDRIFEEKTTGRIIVSSFASLINRIQMVINSAHKRGRKVAVSGRSMENNVRRAFELGYLNVPKDTIVDIRSMNSIPDDRLAILCTGSQGEEYSALVRMAAGEHRQIQLRQGDTIVLSAPHIPGNEHAIHATIDNLFRRGADVIYGRELDIHTSGHAHQEELKMMISLLKGKYFMPIHGEYRFLAAHAKLAQAVGVPAGNIFVGENGSVLEIEKGRAGFSKERVPGGYVLVDGLGVGDVGQIVLRDRQAMAEEGIFVVILTVDRAKGTMIGSPDIISRGFVYMRAAETLIYKARAEISTIFSRHARDRTRQGPMDWEFVKRAIRDDLGQFLYDYTQRRPMIIPVVIEV